MIHASLLSFALLGMLPSSPDRNPPAPEGGAPAGSERREAEDSDPDPAAVEASDRALGALQRQLTLLREGGYGQAVSQTAILGLAFLAAGSTPREGVYAEPLTRCRDSLLENLPRLKEGRRQGRTNASWGYAFAGMFLAELQMREPDDRYVEGIRLILRELDAMTIEPGAWSYGWDDRFAHTGATNTIVIGLDRIRAAGFAEDAQALLDRAAPQYEGVVEEDGWCSFRMRSKVYGRPWERPQENGNGRVAATLLALQALGRRESDDYARALAYWRENRDDVMTNHSPNLYVYFHGVLCRRLGGEDWTVYRDRYLAPMRVLQNDRGVAEILFDDSVVSEDRKLGLWNLDRQYTTAAMTTALVALAQRLDAEHAPIVGE